MVKLTAVIVAGMSELNIDADLVRGGEAALSRSTERPVTVVKTTLIYVNETREGPETLRHPSLYVQL